MQWDVAAVPQIFNKLHQGSDSYGSGVAGIDDSPSLCQFLLQVPEGLLIDPSEPSGLNLMGPLCQSLGAYCQVLMVRRSCEDKDCGHRLLYVSRLASAD